MKARFLTPASDELRSAIAYYDSKAEGLGDRFLEAVEDGLGRISQYPDAGQQLVPGIRRYLLVRFPYALIYTIEEGENLIIAVAHLHKKPEYWQDRQK